MKGYELTERGKIAIAVVLAIFLIILAAILAIRVWNSPTSPFDNQQQPLEPDFVYNPPEITIIPLPEDSDDDTDSATENGEQGSFDPPQEPTEDPAEELAEEALDESSEDEHTQNETQDETPATGGARLNRAACTMTFRFSPSTQESLDADTIALIGDFISSPRNTADSRIVVSMPQLPEVETAKIIAAITDAFAQNGVTQRELGFTVHNTSSGNDSYEIRLYFAQTTTRK